MPYLPVKFATLFHRKAIDTSPSSVFDTIVSRLSPLHSRSRYNKVLATNTEPLTLASLHSRTFSTAELIHSQPCIRITAALRTQQEASHHLC